MANMEPIHQAAFNGDVAAIDRLVAEDGGRLNKRNQAELNINKDTIGRITPIMLAAYKGHDPAVARLLALGADVGHTDTKRQSAAHWACLDGDHSSVLTRLLAGADMNGCDNRKRTPLMLAAEKNRASCVELLIDRGGNALDLDAKDGHRDTALHFAVFSPAKPRIVSMLLGAGADPTVQNRAGDQALDYVEREGDLDELLRAAEYEPQRSRTLFKARKIIDGTRPIHKAKRDAEASGVVYPKSHLALIAAAPKLLKTRVAFIRELPRVEVVEEGRDEKLLATVKYVLGLEGGGGVMLEGQEPTVGMLPEVMVELLELMVPKWEPARKGHPLCKQSMEDVRQEAREIRAYENGYGCGYEFEFADELGDY